MAPPSGRCFRRVTVPMLAPVLSVVFITMLINGLKVFEHRARGRAGIQFRRTRP